MRYFILTLLSLISAGLHGGAVNRVTDHLGISDGLSNNFVTAIAQDGYGFLWFATDNGLNRFDGERFIVFSEKDRTLKGNSVNSLYYDDASGCIWVGTKKGIDIIDCRTLNSAGPEIPQELCVQSMAGFAPDGKDGIYILANYGYIGYYDRAADSCRIFRESDFSGLVMSMLAAACDTDGRLIAGQENYGLSIIDVHNRKLENFMHEPHRTGSLPGNNVNAVLVSSTGDIYAGTDHGVCRLDRESGQFERIELTDSRGNPVGNGSIVSLVELSDGRILASDEDVLFEDRYGNIWLGTAGNGIEFIPAHMPLFARTGIDKRAAGALIAGKNSLTAGIKNEIAEVTGNDVDVVCNLAPYLANPNAAIAAMTPTDDGVLVSVAGEGIFLADMRSGQISAVATPYDNDYASCICATGDNHILLGTQHGLYEYDKDCIRRNEKISSATGYLVPNGITTDRLGRLWIGTYGNGIFVFDNDTTLVTHLTSDSGLASNAVKQLFTDSRLWIWMAGQDGISLIRDVDKPGEIESFTYDSGLADISIRSIAEDQDGNIWLASNNLLYRYNARADSIESFGSRFKVTESSFIDRAAATGPDGRLYFGALDGIYSFLPQDLARLETNTPVSIVGYSIPADGTRPGDETLLYNPGECIELPKGCGSVRIMVSIPDFSMRGKALHSYFVEGRSSEWIPVPDSHEIILRDLNPGEYVLKIRTDGIFGTDTGGDTTKLKISVKRHWWASRTAMVIYVLLGCGIIAAAIVFMRRRIIRSRCQNPPAAEPEIPDNNQEADMSPVDREFLDRFMTLVEQNIGKTDLDMEFFRVRLNMSHSTLYRRLKNLTGMSGNELIKKYRLRKGYDMLRQGFSVSETAYACGFSDPGYFRTCFKNEYGKAPSEMKNTGSRERPE